jgi:hypothetical protein
MTRRNENPELSEWDMEMPRNNKFHDPLAAPLEPTPEKFEKANEEAWSLNRYDFAEAYAAAVSKNLQERADYWKRRAEAAWEREENACGHTS